MVKSKSTIREGLDNRIFNTVVYILLILCGLLALYPLWFTVIASFSDPNSINNGEVFLLPKGFALDGYQRVFQNKWVLVGYCNSIVYTVIGTTIRVIVTVMAAYSLSRKDMFGRPFFSWLIAIPMWFGGGLIPTYLVVNSLGLVNKPYVLIILGLVSSYNIIVCRSFLSGLPIELQEAAKIDGASDFRIFFGIILPLSKSIIAVLSLYYAVGMWNDYFTPMIYINDNEHQTLQFFLRSILLMNQNIDVTAYADPLVAARLVQTANLMKYSLIIIASVPLLIVYPFVQKHFVKGVMIGSVKG